MKLGIPLTVIVGVVGVVEGRVKVVILPLSTSLSFKSVLNTGGTGRSLEGLVLKTPTG